MCCMGRHFPVTRRERSLILGSQRYKKKRQPKASKIGCVIELICAAFVFSDTASVLILVSDADVPQ